MCVYVCMHKRTLDVAPECEFSRHLSKDIFTDRVSGILLERMNVRTENKFSRIFLLETDFEGQTIETHLFSSLVLQSFWKTLVPRQFLK